MSCGFAFFLGVIVATIYERYGWNGILFQGKKSMMIDEKLRLDLINSIIGSWRIEGLYLNCQVVADMHSLSLGLIDIQQAVNNVLARFAD